MKKNHLKSILIPVSALAIAAGGAYHVRAEVRVTLGNAETNDGGTFNPNGFDNGDTIKLGGNGHTILINNAINVTAINLDNRNPTGVITVDQDGHGASLGSIGNSLNSIALYIDDQVEFTLTGTASEDGEVRENDYSSLGPVILGNTNDVGRNTILNITIPASVTFNNTFNSAADAEEGATLNISGADHIFNEVIGGDSKLGAINIKDAHKITFKEDVTASNITLVENSTIVMDEDVEFHYEAVDGPGTLILNGQKPVSPIGEHDPLDRVIISNVDIDNPDDDRFMIHTKTLDIRNDTKIIISANNVLPDMSITSGDNSSQTGNGTAAYFFSDDDCQVGNVGVVIGMYTEGKTLTATGAIPEGDNKVQIYFGKDGTFNLTGSGIIDIIQNVTQDGGGGIANNSGSFKATFNDNKDLVFKEAIGANEAKIKSFSIENFGNTQSNIKFTKSDVNSNIVAFIKQNIDVRNAGLVINSDIHALSNVIYNIGNQTITIHTDTLYLSGNVVIKANYVNADHISVDFSDVNNIEQGLEIDGNPYPDFNQMILEVTGIQPAPGTMMTMMRVSENFPIAQPQPAEAGWLMI